MKSEKRERPAAGQKCGYVGYLQARRNPPYNHVTVALKRLLFAVLSLVALSGIAQAAQLAVVAEKTNPASNLTSGELIKIFNLRTHNWPNGTPIVLVLRDPSSPGMQLVVRKVFNMSAEQANAFLQSHRGQIMLAESDDAVLHFVSSTHGAIGIVDLYSITSDVKVLKIDDRLPVQPGYLLRGN